MIKLSTAANHLQRQGHIKSILTGTLSEATGTVPHEFMLLLGFSNCNMLLGTLFM